MEKNNESSRKNLLRAVIDSLASRHALGGRFMGRLYYESNTHSGAMIYADLILNRGNAVQVKNVAGKFLITELVLA